MSKTNTNRHTKWNNIAILCLLLTMALTGCTTIVDISTSEPIQPDPEQRSFGTYIDDKRLQVIIDVNIRKAHPVLRDKTNITVTSFNGVILLTGQVPSLELRSLAGETATKVHGVRQVHNELQVKENIPFLTKSNDSWLGTKVKTALLASNEVKGLNIKVIVEDAVVYLLGLVPQQNANTAANVASNVSGIKEVVRVFEFSDPEQ